MAPEPTEVRVEGIKEHSVTSGAVGEEFRIKVYQPLMRADGTERFPVLYVTDGDKLFDAIVALTREMQIFGDCARFIIVGIGYANAQAADVLRMRDFFLRETQRILKPVTDAVASSPTVGGSAPQLIPGETTDASHFLRFFADELIPFVSSRYPARASDNNYYGYSAGGTFGLYALFSRPKLFKRYILNSPGTIYNHKRFAIELIERHVDRSLDYGADVFITVGELEEFYSQFHLTTGCYELVQYLAELNLQHLKCEFKVLSGETHSTSWASGYLAGIRRLFPFDGKSPYRPNFDGQE